MRRVGFQGGSSIFELGSTADMRCFFSAISEVRPHITDSEVFLDELFCRYVSAGKLDSIETGVRELRALFSEMTCSPEVLLGLGWRPGNGLLNERAKTLLELFAGYLDALEHCLYSVRAMLEDWQIFKPIRIVVTDMPEYLKFKNMPLSQYDELRSSEVPIWLR